MIYGSRAAITQYCKSYGYSTAVRYGDKAPIQSIKAIQQDHGSVIRLHTKDGVEFFEPLASRSRLKNLNGVKPEAVIPKWLPHKV